MSYTVENFLSHHNLNYSINPEDLKLFCNNFIHLLVFYDVSKLYFYDVLKFENNQLS